MTSIIEWKMPPIASSANATPPARGRNRWSKGDYANDEQFRQRFQEWVSSVWTDKDRLIASILAEQAAEPAT